MEDVSKFLADLALKAPWVPIVLGSLGALVVVAQMVVVITPSKKDDEILGKIESNSVGKFFLDLLLKFAPFPKK